MIAPEHMDRWSRNERLYRYLLGMGLVVDPVFSDAEQTRIDHMVVSVDLPMLMAPRDDEPKNNAPPKPVVRLVPREATEKE